MIYRNTEKAWESCRQLSCLCICYREEADCGSVYKLNYWLVFCTIFATVNLPHEMSFHGLSPLRRWDEKSREPHDLMQFRTVLAMLGFRAALYVSVSAVHQLTLKAINIRPRKYFFKMKLMYRSRYNHQLGLHKPFYAQSSRKRNNQQ